MDITPLHYTYNQDFLKIKNNYQELILKNKKTTDTFSAKEATKQDQYCSDKYCSTSVNKIQSQKTTFVKKNQSRFLVDKKNIQATLSLPLMQYLFALMYALKILASCSRFFRKIAHCRSSLFFCRGVDESLVKPGGVIRSSID
ncbi:hypothetical protein T4D_13881 [Trichinella pseudospiralis]|uniref:Uncharacterized protein n=1 Tax=Trichinella pseudospiralis TaxID=6337 RepID=A0A0V1FR81_TRIPS|nr:hypothetical protein T4D_13881 [Trichinella pseudospiralis]